LKNFRKSVQKIKLALKSDTKKGHSAWRPTYIFTIPRSIILKMKNFFRKILQKCKAHVLWGKAFFFWKWCRLRDNVKNYVRVGHATADNIMKRMRIAYWITKAKDKHSEYVIPIAYPRQQWLRERAAMLRYTYIACTVGLVVTRRNFVPVVD
jgi:hypothetical protein